MRDGDALHHELVRALRTRQRLPLERLYHDYTVECSRQSINRHGSRGNQRHTADFRRPMRLDTACVRIREAALDGPRRTQTITVCKALLGSFRVVRITVAR